MSAASDVAALRLACGSGAAYQRAAAPRLLSRREARAALAAYEQERRQAGERRARRALDPIAARCRELEIGEGPGGWAPAPPAPIVPAWAAVGLEIGEGRWAAYLPERQGYYLAERIARGEAEARVRWIDPADLDPLGGRSVGEWLEASDRARASAEATIDAGLARARQRALDALVREIAAGAWLGRADWRAQIDESAAWVRRVRRMG